MRLLGTCSLVGSINRWWSRRPTRFSCAETGPRWMSKRAPRAPMYPRKTLNVMVWVTGPCDSYVPNAAMAVTLPPSWLASITSSGKSNCRRSTVGVTRSRLSRDPILQTGDVVVRELTCATPVWTLHQCAEMRVRSFRSDLRARYIPQNALSIRGQSSRFSRCFEQRCLALA